MREKTSPTCHYIVITMMMVDGMDQRLYGCDFGLFLFLWFALNVHVCTCLEPLLWLTGVCLLPAFNYKEMMT